MSDTTDIMEKAEALSELIAEHSTTKEMMASQKALAADQAAIMATQQFEQYAMQLARKQQMGQPITAQERAQLEQMQMAVVSNPMLGRYQTAQMNYLDLLRQVHEKLVGADEAAQTAMGQEPGVQGGGGSPLMGV